MTSKQLKLGRLLSCGSLKPRRAWQEGGGERGGVGTCRWCDKVLRQTFLAPCWPPLQSRSNYTLRVKPVILPTPSVPCSPLPLLLSLRPLSFSFSPSFIVSKKRQDRKSARQIYLYANACGFYTRYLQSTRVYSICCYFLTEKRRRVRKLYIF